MKVGLFIPCYIDQFYPQVGVATLQLLEKHGCTVHLVTAGVDEGPIIAQAAVPVLPNDTEASLAARVLAAEHKLYPAALSWLAAGHVRLEADRVEITGAESAPDSLLNPLPRAALLSTH